MVRDADTAAVTEPQVLPELAAERERRARRLEAAAQRGWRIRYDPLMLEFTGARGMQAARTADALLDLIEAAEAEEGQ